MIKWLCPAVRKEHFGAPLKLAGQPFFLFASRFVFAALICCVIGIGFPVDVKAETVIAGRLSVVKGKVTVERPGLGKVLTVQSGSELLVGDVLTTGMAANAQIVLRDSADINIAPDASLRVNQYSYSPDSNRRKAYIKLIRGKARFVSNKKMSRDSSIVVETEGARVTASGQVDFVMNVTPEETEALTLSGFIKVRNMSDVVVGEIALSENLTTTVKPKRPPSQPVVMKAKQRKEYIRKVR